MDDRLQIKKQKSAGFLIAILFFWAPHPEKQCGRGRLGSSGGGQNGHLRQSTLLQQGICMGGKQRTENTHYQLHKTIMKKILLATFACLVLAAGAQAQISITADTFTFNDNFTSYAGTGEPANWSVTGTTGPVYQGEGTGSSTTGGIWSYGPAGSTDRALGYLPNSTTAQTFVATLSFVNNTGKALESFSLSYTAEQWRLVNDGRTNGFTVDLIYNGIVTPLTSLSFTASNSGTTGAVDGNSATYSTNLSTGVTPFVIADGDSFSFRWSGDRGGGSGSSQGIAIDNVSLTTQAIPEPGSALMFGMGTIGLMTILRRRRRQTA